jgi:hypothetical protein
VGFYWKCLFRSLVAAALLRMWILSDQVLYRFCSFILLITPLLSDCLALISLLQDLVLAAIRRTHLI